MLFVIRKNCFIYVWSHFQVQGHILGQVVTLYQICCTKTQNETTQHGGFCTALKIVRTVKKSLTIKIARPLFLLCNRIALHRCFGFAFITMPRLLLCYMTPICLTSAVKQSVQMRINFLYPKVLCVF